MSLIISVTDNCGSIIKSKHTCSGVMTYGDPETNPLSMIDSISFNQWASVCSMPVSILIEDNAISPLEL